MADELTPTRLVGGPWDGHTGRVVGTPEDIRAAGWRYRRTGERIMVTDMDPITSELDTREGLAYEWDGCDPTGKWLAPEPLIVPGRAT